MIMTVENQQIATATTTTSTNSSSTSSTNSFDYYKTNHPHDNDLNIASRSVPGSRRNSNDDSKRSNSLFDSSFGTSTFDSPIDFLMKPPPRSFSIDVGSMHSELNHHNHNTNYTSSLFFDDHDSNTDTSTTTTPSFHPTSHGHYLHSSRYNSSSGNSSSLLSNNSSSPATYGLFASSASDLDLGSSLRKNSARSVESLRSKSWAQFLDTTTAAAALAISSASSSSSSHQQYSYPTSSSSSTSAVAAATGPLDGVSGTASDVQAAFYGPARRFSHGWVPTTTTTTAAQNMMSTSSFASSPSLHQPLAKTSSRLTTSYSYSDLHMAAALGSYRMNNSISSNTNVEICQNFRQYGYCTLKEQCPYSHMPTVLQQQDNIPPHHQAPPQLRYSNSTSTCNSNYHQHHHQQHSNHPLSQYHHPHQQQQQHYHLDPTLSLYDPSINNSPNLLLNKTISNNSSLTVERRSSDNEMNKFAGLQLEEFQGKLYELSHDQHGCRFLQMKLEESAHNVTMIYNEIHLHFVDLMTDPFGNYLCQKLLERCDDDQRSSIVDVIAPEFLKICLSMHGTRAVQKLIEFLSTKRQIQAVIVALQPNVVALIKDLNGNHVIQKCLHRLSPEHNQFIYDTVSEFCIEVASHKHGCCVYQRCIDHAVQSQKDQLVNVITQNALPLVQDPFGNYVVQYVLELGDAKYSDDLIRRFIEPVRELSVQKFSSNVIEKCIRVAERDTRRLLIAGIINHPNMERFLRDSYANYVIQTCLDFAEEDQRAQFIDCIRPLLPSIRNTPYGKRIYSKIHNTAASTILRNNTTTTLRQQQQQPVQRVMMADSILNSMNELSLNNTAAMVGGSRTNSNTANSAATNDTSVYI